MTTTNTFLRLNETLRDSGKKATERGGMNPLWTCGPEALLAGSEIRHQMETGGRLFRLHKTQVIKKLKNVTNHKIMGVNIVLNID